MAALAAGSTAFAHNPALSRLKLEWDAPEGCVDRKAAQAAIENALRTTSAANGQVTVVRVKIAELRDGRWNADIWMYGALGSGDRSFEGGSCQEVAEATTLIVALALDASPSPDAESASADDASAPGRGTGSSASMQARERAQIAAGVRATGDVGSLPGPDLGMALVLALQYRRARAEIEGMAWLPRTEHPAPIAGGGGKFGLYTGGLRGCLDLLRSGDGAFNLGPCAGAEAGMTTGTGIGLSRAPQRRNFWGAGLLGLSVRYLGASPLWLGMLAEVGVPFHRAAWQIDDFGTVFQASPIVQRGSLGVGWLFP